MKPEVWTHKYVATRVTPGPTHRGIRSKRTTVTAGLHHIENNKAPYFSVTCSIDEQAMNNRWMEAGGGASHEHIARLFPHLAPVIALHLAYEDGTPMHATANAIYHAGFSQYPDARCDEHLASHLRITPTEAMQLVETCAATDDPAQAMTDYVAAQRERFAQEARDAIAVLDELIERQASKVKG